MGNIDQDFCDEVSKIVGGLILENKKELEATRLKEKKMSMTIGIKIKDDEPVRITFGCTTNKIKAEKEFVPGQGKLDV